MSQPKLPERGSRWVKRKLYTQEYGAPATRRNTVVNSADIMPEQPVDTDRFGIVGYPHNGEFTIGAVAGNTVNLDLGDYANLNSSLGVAYMGGQLLIVATRNGGAATVARGMGDLLIVVNFWNGSGRGTSPYCFVTGSINQGDEFRLLGIDVSASISGDDLVITVTNELGLGGTILGRFWWKPMEET